MERFTRQREAIRRDLAGRKDHPTAEMLYEDLRGTFPNLSLATVYRNLSRMSERGEIRRLAVEEDPSLHFDHDTSGHSHFFCRRCGKLTDIPEILPDDRRAEVEERLGIRVEKVSTVYYGLCTECRASGEDPNQRS